MKTTSRFLLMCVSLLAATSGCHRDSHKSIDITLDWKPEPEFGGFYQAQLFGAFESAGLAVELKSAGAGAPTWQLVANGQTEFATTAADQVLIARAHGVDVVAVFAVYQTFPQGIMVHKARGFTTIEDVFTHPGTLAAENDTWLKYLLAKFSAPQVKITEYGSGISAFLAKPDFSQQCFVTSEPLLAKRQGSDPQTFLIADSGYNPYTTVLITSGDTIRNNPQRVKLIVDACRQGWQSYLKDPSAANTEMGKLNTEMDSDTFKRAAEVQAPLIEKPGVALGSMTVERWSELGRQLVQLKVIDSAPDAQQCFIDPDTFQAKH